MLGGVCVFITQSCLTLCDPMGCSLPGSSVHGISQARTLEWAAVSFFRRSSRPRDYTHVSRVGGGGPPLESIPQAAASPKNRGSLVVQEDNKLGTSDIIFS